MNETDYECKMFDESDRDKNLMPMVAVAAAPKFSVEESYGIESLYTRWTSKIDTIEQELVQEFQVGWVSVTKYNLKVIRLVNFLRTKTLIFASTLRSKTENKEKSRRLIYFSQTFLLQKIQTARKFCLINKKKVIKKIKPTRSFRG